MKRKVWFAAVAAALSLGAGVAQAQKNAPGAPQNLEQLFNQVQDQSRLEAQASAAREKEFTAQKHLQAQKLKAAREQLAAERARFEQLGQKIDAQDELLDKKRAQLKENTGDLGELFGVMRTVAGEASGLLKSSLLTVQYPGKSQAADKVAQSKALASQKEIEDLWRSILWNMVKSGSVERFEGPLIAKDGTVNQAEILRVGTFSAFSNGEYLRFLPTGDSVKLIELSRQPARSYKEEALTLQKAPVGEVSLVSIDPSRGSVVELLVQSPTWQERLSHGGVVGYIILGLGALGLLIAIERLFYLAFVGAKVRNQRSRSDRPRASNPLGRLLLVAQQYEDLDAEALLLRLEEQLAKELPKLKRGLGVIALFAATAPLLGLLGTVTGMIETFQSITLFGNGDPKMMSGGISQALVTTKLGLAVSIPLMLVHAWVSQRANQLGRRLDEQSTKSVADRLTVGDEPQGEPTV